MFNLLKSFLLDKKAQTVPVPAIANHMNMVMALQAVEAVVAHTTIKVAHMNNRVGLNEICIVKECCLKILILLISRLIRW